jgi:hypothetical protein
MNRTSRLTSLPSSRGNNLRSMKQGIAGLATTLLLFGGLGLAVLGLGAGTAQAAPPSSPYTWCPGDVNFPRFPGDSAIWIRPLRVGG